MFGSYSRALRCRPSGRIPAPSKATTRVAARALRGSLTAAAQIRKLLERSAGWQKILGEQAAAGAGKMAHAQLRVSHRGIPAAKAAQIAGFRIVSDMPPACDDRDGQRCRAIQRLGPDGSPEDAR